MTDRERLKIYYENEAALKVKAGEEICQTWAGRNDLAPRYVATRKLGFDGFIFYEVVGKSLKKIATGQSPYEFERYVNYA